PVEFEMYGEREVRMPLFTGYLARGILLQAIGRVDPAASQVLHEPNIRKAYAVTPLRFRSRARLLDGYLLDPTHPCLMGVRFLADEYAKLLLKCFEEKQSFLIYDTPFSIVTVKVKSKSYRELWDEAKPVEVFRLYFQTPTCFAALGRRYYCLFPEPKRVFGNLLDLWNKYSDIEKTKGSEREEYLRWLGKEAGVSGYCLETRREPTRKGNGIGFTGWVAYRLGNKERWKKRTACLARLAEYSNVGKNRTEGFGVTKARIEGR
ncbi:MAG: CRISPR-associated endoribonuclease Cas6, partial [Candidatus Verstraetearchaeota archaeon]|nr:CRISPR-associated endoribonuclease Cas6 [Candidatus Verstraetearchaeota archaeon]